MDSYFLKDIAGVTAAAVLFSLFALAPGYSLAWLLNPLSFRQRTFIVRLSIGVVLSISMTPILVFLLGSLSTAAVWIFYGALWAVFLLRFRGPFSIPRPALILGAIWFVVAMFSLIDLQIGDRLYFPVSAYDFTFRTAVIDSLTRDGLPAVNPFFHPGHNVVFRYHYLWFYVCSFVNRLGAGLFTARQVQIAGAIWVGFGLMAIVALYARFFDPRGADQVRRRAIVGASLLAITGFDILPIALNTASHLPHLKVFPCSEWWNSDQVTGWVNSMIWVPHHLCGLIACLTGFLVLWDNKHARAASCLIAALAFASASGESIYVTLVFALGLGVWGVVSLRQRRFAHVRDIATAGIVSAIFALPYLLTLRNPDGKAARLLIPAVRSFRPLDAALGKRLSQNALTVVDFAALPLNYFLEFGFYFLVGILIYKRLRKSRSVQPFEMAAICLGGTALLFCTFVRSGVIGNNDLGWRGMLIAQFFLLLFGIDYAMGPWRRSILTVALCLGALGTLYELGGQRLHPVLADAGWIIEESDWGGPERGMGARTKSLRQIYEFMDAHTPLDAVVQHNPAPRQDIPSGLYADRQRALMGTDNWGAFGGNPLELESETGPIHTLFQNGFSDIESACRQLSIDILVVNSNDPVWKDRASWVWTRKPFASASDARAYKCRDGSSLLNSR